MRQCDLQHGRSVAKQEEQQLEQLDHHFRRVLWCMLSGTVSTPSARTGTSEFMSFGGPKQIAPSAPASATALAPRPGKESSNGAATRAEPVTP